MKISFLLPVLLPVFLPSQALYRFPLAGVPADPMVPPAEEQWFQQKLDHFNVRDVRLYHFRN